MKTLQDTERIRYERPSDPEVYEYCIGHYTVIAEDDAGRRSSWICRCLDEHPHRYVIKTQGGVYQGRYYYGDPYPTPKELASYLRQRGLRVVEEVR